MTARADTRQSDRQRARRLSLTIVFHAGSVLIAAGIAMLILGEPEWYWGAMAIVLGTFVWARVFMTMYRDASRGS